MRHKFYCKFHIKILTILINYINKDKQILSKFIIRSIDWSVTLCFSRSALQVRRCIDYAFVTLIPLQAKMMRLIERRKTIAGHIGSILCRNCIKLSSYSEGCSYLTRRYIRSRFINVTL